MILNQFESEFMTEDENERQVKSGIINTRRFKSEKNGLTAALLVVIQNVLIPCCQENRYVHSKTFERLV